MFDRCSVISLAQPVTADLQKCVEGTYVVVKGTVVFTLLVSLQGASICKDSLVESLLDSLQHFAV